MKSMRVCEMYIKLKKMKIHETFSYIYIFVLNIQD